MIAMEVGKVGNNLLKSNSLVFTFLRSIVSSQAASWCDMALRFVFFTWVLSAVPDFYRSNISVAVGALVGGIVNCCINYRFTFRAQGQSVKAVAVKYFLVWTGSLLLNMYGTTYFAEALSHWQWLINLGFKPVGIFSVATLIVSLLVSWFWNFALQRSFVYKPTRFDPYAQKFVDLFTPHKSK